MKKALLVLYDLRKGNGVASCLMQYYPHLITEYEIDFILLRSTNSFWEKYVYDCGSNIFIYPKSRFKYSKRGFKFLTNVYSRGYDIVHVNVPGPEGALFLKYAQKNKVNTRIYHAHNPNNKMSLHSVLNSLLFGSLCLKRSNCYLACSEDAGKSVFGKKSFKILKNRIESERFSFNDEKREMIRKELGIKGDTFLIGSVGRLEKQKNPLYAIRCFKHLYSLNNDVELVWVGSGSLRKRLEKIIVKNKLEKRVHLVGSQENVSDWYSAMDCFLLPSLFEGLGIVFIEAQASGLQCFGSLKVPADVIITDLMHRIDTKMTPELFANQMLIDMKSKNDRKIYSSLIKNAGYDISNGFLELNAIYNDWSDIFSQ